MFLYTKIKRHMGHKNSRTPSIGNNATTIASHELKELYRYADSKKIQLVGFKKYTGNIEAIKTMIDNIAEIADDFPKVLTGRKKVAIRLYTNLLEDNFATTTNSIINITNEVYNNIEALDEDYKKFADSGEFVRGTDYHAIERHEMGHVIKYVYRIGHKKIISIAKDITGIDNESELTEYLKNNLSRYSTEYANGEEIIAEVFAAHYSNINNEFAEKFFAKIKQEVAYET